MKKSFRDLYDELTAARVIIQVVMKESEDMMGVDCRELRDKLSECEELIGEAMREAIVLEVDQQWNARGEA